MTSLCSSQHRLLLFFLCFVCKQNNFIRLKTGNKMDAIWRFQFHFLFYQLYLDDFNIFFGHETLENLSATKKLNRHIEEKSI